MLVNAVSHERLTPLNSIINMSELTMRELGDILI